MANDSTFFINIKTDSTINEQLYFITGKVLSASKDEKIPAYTLSGKPLHDTAEISSWLSPKYKMARPSIQLIRLKVRFANGQYIFAPDNGRPVQQNKSGPWLLLADTKSILSQSEYVYLENALSKKRTTVLYRRIIDITANEKFDNSFNNPRNGIAGRLKDFILSAEVTAYDAHFDSTVSYMGKPSSFPGAHADFPSYSDSNWLFSIKISKAIIDNAFYLPPSGFQPGWAEDFSYYQFIFLCEEINGQLMASENNLFALGPAEKNEGGKSKWKFPVLVDYYQMCFLLSGFQRQIIADVLGGNVNRNVSWKFSESCYSVSQQKDTALTRILHRLWEATREGEIYAFYDGEFRVKCNQFEILRKSGGARIELGDLQKAMIDTIVRPDAFSNISALGIVNGWYRTNVEAYENASCITGFMPMFYDSVEHDYYPAFYWHVTELKVVLGEKDFEVLMNYVAGKTIETTAQLRVINDSLLSDGTHTFHPLNLFSTFQNGDTVTCTYRKLHATTRVDKDSDSVYLVNVGKRSKKHVVNSAELVPFPVSMPGFYFPGGNLFPSDWGWTYCDQDKNVAMPLRFLVAFPFSESRARVGKSKVVDKMPVMSYAFIDSTGKELCGYIFQEARDFHNGYAAVKQNGKWGFVNRSMKIVVLCAYDTVRDFENGYAAVREKHNGAWMFVNEKAKSLSIYGENAGDFENEVVRVKVNNKWMLFDTKGKARTTGYDTIAPFSGGLAMVRLNAAYGFINEQGTLAIPLEYSGARSFMNGSCAVNQNGKWGFLDKKGNVKIPVQYECAGYFSGNLFSVKQNGKWGFADAQNTIQIACLYDSVGTITKNLFPFYKKSLRSWGVADLKGKEFIPAKWRTISFFPGGWCIAFSDKQMMIYDPSGKGQEPIRYYTAPGSAENRGYFNVWAYGSNFLVDYRGKEFLLQ
ncbi:MAG: WG repeat-containing protein [Bacteroidota bacterium]|nr:WG repeat-containing protein [Bacteroidota bacterium]